MATHPRLVNKQFNSPIGLYSAQNVQEILDKNTQILANGAVGVDFHNPNIGKPSNLQNSAVLRMLEEEENRRRNGYAPGTGAAPKRVAWPPPNEAGPDSPYVEQNAVTEQGGPQFPSRSQPTPTPRAPLRPLDVSQTAPSPLASPVLNQSPQGFRPAVSAKPWAPVSPRPDAHPFSGPQGYPQGCPSPAPQPFSLQSQLSPKVQAGPVGYSYPRAVPSGVKASGGAHSPAGAAVQSPQVQAARSFEPPPSTITLRSQAPVSQPSPPVYASQPATATIKVKVSPKNLRGDQKWPPEGVKQSMSLEAENLNPSNSFLSLQGGKHLRGDLKWPPENVKMQAEEENRLRIELAKGPVCRPRRPNKDYSAFFAQNALNSTYPGYKIPPGTQFFRQF